MQDFIVPLAAFGTATGLVIAGINIAKGKKNYVGRDEHTKTIERVHSRIDEQDDRIDSLQSQVGNVECKVDVMSREITEIKCDVSVIGKSVHNIEIWMSRIEAIMEERRKL